MALCPGSSPEEMALRVDERREKGALREGHGPETRGRRGRRREREA